MLLIAKSMDPRRLRAPAIVIGGAASGVMMYFVPSGIFQLVVSLAKGDTFVGWGAAVTVSIIQCLLILVAAAVAWTTFSWVGVTKPWIVGAQALALLGATSVGISLAESLVIYLARSNTWLAIVLQMCFLVGSAVLGAAIFRLLDRICLGQDSKMDG